MGKVIGITGCTRSGKSWVAKELASALRARGLRATVVSQDSFWRRAVQISLRTPSVSGASKETQAWSEEEPACVDHAAFASQIRSKRDECDVVIAEGFLLAHAAEVVAALGAIFLLECDEQEARRRRTDVVGPRNSNPQSRTVFDSITWPAHLRYLADSVQPLGERVRRVGPIATAADVAGVVARIVDEVCVAAAVETGAVGALAAGGEDERVLDAAASGAPPAEGPEPGPPALWPCDKLQPAVAPAAGGGSGAVLLVTGAMNPPHRGHVAMLHMAAARLREAGLHVLGAFLSPSHDAYVQPKAAALGTLGLSAPFRLAVARAAVADDPLVAVGAWEASQPGSWPDFPVVCAALQRELGCDGGGPRVFYVCGTDHADKCGLWRGMRHGIGVVVVPRAAAAAKTTARPRGEAPEQGVYVAAPAEGAVTALSSTRVRAALARRDHAAASAMLSPAAADLLLRPSAREHARWAADHGLLGVPPPATA